MSVAFLLILAGYLIGSISSAIITCKLMGLEDPRQSGSGNPGATNVLRTGSKKAAIITLCGDLLKGFIPPFVAIFAQVAPTGICLIGLAAFIGHLYPVFYNFKGGKGVATSAGVLLAIHWPLGLACLVTWILSFAVKRISSLAALTTAALAPVLAFATSYNQPAEFTVPLVITSLVIGLFIFWRHRSNIQRLLSKEEK